MAFGIAYLVVWTLTLVGGLVLDGMHVDAGAWLALVGVALTVPLVFEVPAVEDVPRLLLGALVALPSVLGLDAVGAPRGVTAIVVGAVVSAALFVPEPGGGGQLRIPPGYRFSEERRRGGRRRRG